VSRAVSFTAVMRLTSGKYIVRGVYTAASYRDGEPAETVVNSIAAPWGADVDEDEIAAREGAQWGCVVTAQWVSAQVDAAIDHALADEVAA
jgi:hypothetical protein